ncbi:MAG: Antilisterial bacteriocin subtilosin biosynthesis protein AlbA [candidate division WS2 bacterium]|nr:Antilisterial bacteriocin subtilosin biosynthesis protein AlbA [Candidatus Psychracetigena formicireducens]
MEKNFSFQWHLTDLCNLRCQHCYQTVFNNQRDLSLDENLNILYDVVINLKKNGYDSLSINLTGGEPLISNLTYQLLDNITNDARFSLVKEVNIITNGLFAERLHPYLNNSLLKKIKISLEGPTREVNDALRGIKVFDKVIANIKLLPPEKVIFMFTLAHYNYRHLEDMVELAIKTGVKGLILERFVPLGRGKNIIEKTLNAGQWYKCLEFISQNFQMPVFELLPYKAFWIDLEKKDCYGATCNLGDESMCLMPDGVVYPCRRLPEVLGNLQAESFAKVIKRLSEYRSQFDRRNLKGKCQHCEIPECIGCRATALALEGDAFADDKQCFLSNQENSFSTS